jgi:hypothetical protein
VTSENRAGGRDQSIERVEAERRELEAAGWEPKGQGARTLWRRFSGGRWYAHYQALEMQRKGKGALEEERLLHEHGFERKLIEGREVWSRYEQGSSRLYTRFQALERARKEEK